MIKQEFEKLTGVTVTFDEYQNIEERYMAFDGDKRAFAKAFMENGGPGKVYAARVQVIDHLRDKLTEQEKAHLQRVKALEKLVADLRADLDQLLEWKPAERVGTNKNQIEYCSHRGRLGISVLV